MPSRVRRLSFVSTALLALVAVAAACSGAVDTSPKGVVEQALRHVERKETAALTELACAKSRDQITRQLDFTGGLGSFLPPGFDTQKLLDAVEIDASKLVATEKSVTGDAAVVSVAGTVGFTIDEEPFKDVIREVARTQGMELDDAQLNGMMLMLKSFSEAVPLETDLNLVREDGAWKICE